MVIKKTARQNLVGKKKIDTLEKKKIYRYLFYVYSIKMQRKETFLITFNFPRTLVPGSLIHMGG